MSFTKSQYCPLISKGLLFLRPHLAEEVQSKYLSLLMLTLTPIENHFSPEANVWAPVSTSIVSISSSPIESTFSSSSSSHHDSNCSSYVSYVWHIVSSCFAFQHRIDQISEVSSNSNSWFTMWSPCFVCDEWNRWGINSRRYDIKM